MARLLGLVDLDTPIRQLSTGNKLRAALIGALIHRPALVLLDEPTLGLDLEGVERLHELVHQGAAEGQTFLIGSHDLNFIERLCPRIVCIHGGRKRFDGRTCELCAPGLPLPPAGQQPAGPARSRPTG